MSDLGTLFGRALDEFDRRLSLVSGDQWRRSTPCSEWDVRSLVAHVTSEQLWAPLVLEGRTTAEVGDRFDGDPLGPDPLSAWREAATAARTAAEEPNVLERTVHLSYGESTGENYLAEMTVDATVHGWDLARGIGADDRLDPELVRLALRYAEPHQDMLAASGMFGSPVPVPSGSDEQSRLLAMLGRVP